MNYNDFSYFCFHTPFSKQVQKTFYALLLTDIEEAWNEKDYDRYDIKLSTELHENQFKNDVTANKILTKWFANDWRDKSEISLELSK